MKEIVHLFIPAGKVGKLGYAGNNPLPILRGGVVLIRDRFHHFTNRTIGVINEK